MPHDVSLIATLAFGFGLALIFGFIAEKLKTPALLGYLVAGFLIGPATPGFVADPALTNQLAEVGVMLLMFGVGMHFSLNDLLAVKKIAVPGAIVQMTTATLLKVALFVSLMLVVGKRVIPWMLWHIAFFDGMVMRESELR